MNRTLPETHVPTPVPEIVCIAACILLCACFSVSETALTSLTETKILDLMQNPKRWGTKRLRHWLRSNTRILTSLLIGNTLVNIVGSILGARVAYMYIQAYAEAIAIGVMTLLILTIGEIIPKTIGKLWYTRLAPWAMLFALAIDRLLFPLSWLFNLMATRVFYGLRRALASPDHADVTEGEIEHMILKGEAEGVLDKSRGEILRSVLEFKDTIAKEIMIPGTRIVAVSSDAGIDKALDVAISTGHSRIPVYSGRIDNIDGMLYAKDLLSAIRKRGSEGVTLKDLVRRPPFFVPETKKVSELLAEMQKKRVHVAIVVDEFGTTSGLITLEDIIEEIVGEIHDEYDKDESPIRKTADGTWEAVSWTSIYELGEAIGVEIPDSGEYETLGGFLINLHGSVPQAGKSLHWGGYRFTIIDAETKRINTVRIQRLREPEPPSGE